MAELKFSDQPAATIPLHPESRIPVSESDGLGGFSSKYIEAQDLLSGSWETGALFINCAPSTPLLDVNTGSVHVDNTSGLIARIGGTLETSVTSGVNMLSFVATLKPTGASLSNGRAMLLDVSIDDSSAPITSAIGIQTRILTGASYSGNITQIVGYAAITPSLSGSGTLGTVIHFDAGAISANNNATSGTKSNIGYRVGAHTAASNGATVHNRGVSIVVSTGGSTSGQTHNRGVSITGNGGTAAGGTVENHAIYNESTAKNYFAGGIGIGTTTDPGVGNLLVAGTIKAGGFTVATLPAVGNAGRRAYVTDANATFTAGIGAVVAGGGANVVPVFDDGTNWRIG